MGDQQAAPPLSTKVSAGWPCNIGPGQSEGRADESKPGKCGAANNTNIIKTGAP
jgi:hypothetical protein